MLRGRAGSSVVLGSVPGERPDVAFLVHLGGLRLLGVLVAAPLVLAAATHLAARAARGEPATVTGGLRGAARRFPAFALVWGLVATVGFGVMIGIISLFVSDRPSPGGRLVEPVALLAVVVASAIVSHWLLAFPQLAIERRGWLEALRESGALVAGHRLPIVASMLALWLLGRIGGTIVADLPWRLFGFDLYQFEVRMLTYPPLLAFAAVLAVAFYLELRDGRVEEEEEKVDPAELEEVEKIFE